MSFSLQVKEELCRAPLSRTCCALAEAYGVLLCANTFTAREIRIMTGSADFARRLPKLFRKALSLEFDSVPPAENRGKAIFTVTSPEKIAAVFDAYGYDACSTVAHHVNLGVLESECCRASFVRGAFLAGGSVTDPAGRCQLELVTEHRSVSKELYALLLEMGFAPKDVDRGGRYVTYFKRSEAIEDLLTTIGAPGAAMAVMSAKIEKDMRSTINRKVNCDSANADKIVSAAQTQLERIRALDREIGLGNLPDDLQEVAMLRIANPEASLSDLALLSPSGMSKSGVNHRLRKLMQYTAP